ncbi:hypothetical protein HPB50_014235 [Hyalomma asiaticum]|uniref:Uncharacterized protein n=1 Tax=Hyalomma asiaticum TaxID=266040 RepID=A0ACB7SXV0_HYAAI|nr:hypothetical protein HPB50_014235 [Hyalomma asiaticum]
MTIPFAKELSLSDIMSHIGAVDTVDTRLRCLTEGEAVLKARHIVCCGVKTCTESLLTVQGLCVQTSHVQSKPHELEFAYSLDGTIKVCRTGIQNLEPLTCTDLKQAWGKLQAAPMYEARELQDLCHVQALPDLHLTEEARERIRQRLVARLPGSALALHIQGRQQQRNAAATHLELTIEHQLLQHICSSALHIDVVSRCRF